MVDLRPIVTVHCYRGVVQCCQQICLDVVDFRSVLVDTVKHIL